MAAMAARATRSASRAAAHTALSERIRDAEAAATGPLGALSHDELGVIFDGLADPLQPVVAVALSSTCLGLRTPLLAALELLQQRHEKADALCRKRCRGYTCKKLSKATDLTHCRITDDDMGTLGMLIKWLPQLRSLRLCCDGQIGVAGLVALLDGLLTHPLTALHLTDFKIGTAGAEAIAAALGMGALPNLQVLDLSCNPIGNQGSAALALALRTMPALECLYLLGCGIGDEGVASLFANLGKDDFKKLEILDLQQNQLTDVGCETLISARRAGRMPALVEVILRRNKVTQAAAAYVAMTQQQHLVLEAHMVPF